MGQQDLSAASGVSSPPTGGPPRSSVLRSAGMMGIATFLSRIMGLVREQVFAVVFGAGNYTDAFNIAFRIPNLLRDLFAEGALSAAFIPTFTKVRKEQGDRAAWRLAGLVFRVLFVLVSVLSLIGVLIAPWLVDLYAGAFRSFPGKFELTVLMTRIMFPFFPLVALAAAFMGILNACGRFFMPAFASALFNVTSVVIGLIGAWLAPKFEMESIVGMAIGVVAGGLVQAFSQFPQLRQAGYRFPKKIESDRPWHQEPALRRIFLLMLPSMVGLAATQINVLVNSILATSQGPGAVSWLNYAFRLMQFPIGVFGVSLAAATLPELSRRWVDRDEEGLRTTLTRSLKTVFAVNLPAAAGLGFLGVPIVELIFQYGRFNALDTYSTARALAAYAVGLGGYSLVKVLVPACYAVGRTRAAVVSSVLSVALTIVFNLLFIDRLGYVGLALGTSVAAIFNALYLLGVLRKHVDLGDLATSFVKHLSIAFLMGIGCLLLNRALVTPVEALSGLFGGAVGARIFARFLRVGLLMVLGGAFVFGVGRLFRIPESTEFGDWIVKKLKNKISKRGQSR